MTLPPQAILLILGIVFIVVSIYSIVKYHKDKNRKYQIIIGKVIRFNKLRTKKANSNIKYISFAPEFEFDFNGQTYLVEHLVGSVKNKNFTEMVPNSKYNIGDPVELRVYIDNPNDAVENNMHIIRLPLYIGILFSFIGVLILVINLGISLS